LTAGALALTLGALVFAIAPGASAAKSVLSTFGGPGTAAAQFGANAPAGAAVNTTGAGGVDPGDLYVADRGGNRIEEFHADGTFVRAFGLNVGGAGIDVCTSTCAVGTSSATAGGLANPWGVAIDQSTGTVYVSGITNKRVDIFSATGEFEGAFGFGVISNTEPEPQFCTDATGCEKGLAGAASGQLGASQGFLAVAPAGSPHAGDVYVADLSNNRIAEYTPTISAGDVTGIAFDKAFGGGVADGVSTGLQTCAATCFKGTAGAAPGQFANGAMRGIAVDGDGNVYAVDAPAAGCAATCRVEKFDATATSVEDFAPARLTFTAGTAQSQAALDVAVDPSDGHVFVAQPASGETRVVEFDPDGVLVEVSGEGSGIPAPATTAAGPCLALGGDGNVFLTSQAAARVYRLNTPPAPGAAISPVTGVGSAGATFNGTVTPVDGVDTRYRFEYSTDGLDWTPLPDVDAGSGSTPVAVHQVATGLEANASYRVRLRADNGTAATTEPVGFTTLAAPPTVSQSVAAAVTAGGATLGAFIDPNNSATSYRLEWGTTTAYGRFAPAEFAPYVGSGGRPLLVGAEITGLQPGTTYHFRVKATSAAGTTYGVDSPFETPPASCPNDALRAQSDLDPTSGRPYSQGLPGCRAYEMVTPLDKGGVDVQLGAEASPVAPDGDAVGFYTIGSTADPNSFNGAELNPFLARRTVAGWGNSSSFAPAALIAGQTGAKRGVAIYSADLTGLAACGQPGLSALAPSPSLVCALRTAGGGWAAGPEYPNLSGEALGGLLLISSYFGGSADLSHIVVQASSGRTHLLPGDETPAGGSLGGGALYELVGLGGGSPTLRLVDVDDSGQVIGPANPTYLGSTDSSIPAGGGDYHAVSADGRTIYFTATPDGGRPTVFARTGEFAGGSEAAPVTVAVSDPEPGGCPGCAPGGGLPSAPGWDSPQGYVGASVDGSRSFFLTSRQLLPADTDATVDLYSYDLAGPVGERLSQVSGGGAGDLSPGAGANVQGVLRVSPTGSHVYFVATGVLTNEPNRIGAAATEGADNIYCWQRDASFPEGRTSFVATVPGADSALWAANGTGESQVTHDGRYLLFATHAALSPADDNGASDIYRYDSGTGDLLLVSPGTGGAGARIGPFPYLSLLGAQPDVDSLTRAISDDGATIVFTTRAALAGDDVNAAEDVYGWHDGTVALVSDGEDPAGADPPGSLFAAAGSPTISPSGSDIFFTTRARLVGQDTDSLADVYDARIDGGFPYVVPRSCEDGERCRAAALQAPPPGGDPASSTWSGPGNPPVPGPDRHADLRRKKGKRHLRKHRHKKHHGGKRHRGHRHGGSSAAQVGGTSKANERGGK